MGKKKKKGYTRKLTTAVVRVLGPEVLKLPSGQQSPPSAAKKKKEKEKQRKKSYFPPS